MILKTYKFRLYPNKKQQELLSKHFGCTRFIYNHMLNLKIAKYKTSNEILSCFTLIKLLPDMRKELLWLQDVSSQSLQAAIRNLDNAFTRFFKQKNGFPKFKSKKQNNLSFQIYQHYKINNGKLYLPKFKDGIKIVQHREFEGKLKTLTISSVSTGKYFVSILVETTDNKILPDTLFSGTTIGVSTGDCLATSNGLKIDSPKWLKKSARRLKIKQRSFQRKEIGSKNREKSRCKLTVIHEKVADQNKDFLQKLSSRIVRENQSICIEHFNLKDLSKKGRLSEFMKSVNCGSFNRQLAYKCDWYGKNLVLIGEFTHSFQFCNDCGIQRGIVEKSENAWTCLNCNAILDKDVNAAKNVKDFGIETYRRDYGNKRLSDMIFDKNQDKKPYL